eukprot:GHVR01157445.1.p1 GENE.GHVR01157445.1~~GHVR01157445.1.p1  ORF type:complete len:203 (-),score=75.73 GHVR01157445.1:416-1024(-)
MSALYSLQEAIDLELQPYVSHTVASYIAWIIIILELYLHIKQLNVFVSFLWKLVRYITIRISRRKFTSLQLKYKYIPQHVTGAPEDVALINKVDRVTNQLSELSVRLRSSRENPLNNPNLDTTNELKTTNTPPPLEIDVEMNKIKIESSIQSRVYAAGLSSHNNNNTHTHTHTHTDKNYDDIQSIENSSYTHTHTYTYTHIT